MPPLNSFDKTVLALALAQMSLAGSAADINVSETCSLADAILSVNELDSIGTCTAGDGINDTINLPANSVITLTAPFMDAELFGDSGLPLIDADVTIQGNGATIERAADADPFRLIGMTDRANVTLTLNSLTLRNGFADGGNDYFGYGGAIYVSEYNSLILNSVNIANNYSGGYGGAIYAYRSDSIEINQSLISGNSAGIKGGGLWLHMAESAANEFLSIDQSAIVNNAGDGTNVGYPGGAIGLYRVSATISNSTISGNSASGGAGIYMNASSVALINTTVSSNHNSNYAGTLSVAGNATYKPGLTLENSIVANSSNGMDPASDCSATYVPIASTTSSIIENLPNLSCFNGSIPMAIQVTDPDLAPLRFLKTSFGNTAFHYPLPDSPVLGAGDATVCAANPVNGVDQIGAERAVDTCSIGAINDPEAETFFVVPIGDGKTVTFSL